ncbi:uncharacterized protein LOC120166623 [Hibiscus syriacus]|uniref:uncharacterized protein LOC120166623 n=1 Tax=Hibiscus syriacus TaxID=106335 RepID=UPI001924BDC0|nr:uncharacterized protein LOC120166623 [Hibiscus syriacus]
MEDCSSHGSTSCFYSQMLYKLRFEVDNETDGISSSVIKGEPVEYLNDFQITGADSNTETGWAESKPTPMERELKRKRYGRRKSSVTLKKTDEKIADMKGTLQKKIDSLSGILKYIERELQEEIDENLYMTMRLKEKQKIKDEQIAEVKLLAKKLDRLRVETEEETGLTLSLHRQQLKPQSFTLQRATDPHIIGTNSDSVDKERRGTNFENVGKFSSMELAASHTISNRCAKGADFLRKLEV